MIFVEGKENLMVIKNKFFKEEEVRKEKWYIRHDLITIKESPLHGIGVFAIDDIPKKTLVEMAPVLLFHNKTMQVLNDMTDPFRHTLMDYPFFWGRNGMMAFGHGFAGLYNHSSAFAEAHNCQWKCFYEDIKGYNALGFLTRRDVKKGEELLTSYSHYEEGLWFKGSDSEYAQTVLPSDSETGD